MAFLYVAEGIAGAVYGGFDAVYKQIAEPVPAVRLKGKGHLSAVFRLIQSLGAYSTARGSCEIKLDFIILRNAEKPCFTLIRAVCKAVYAPSNNLAVKYIVHRVITRQRDRLFTAEKRMNGNVIVIGINYIGCGIIVNMAAAVL